MPYNAVKVANAFIDENNAAGRIGLTPLQLIKLTYIAHGWSFVFLDDPLLNEPVQAWQYGPVVPTLYRAINHYRAKPIATQIQGDNDPKPLDERSRELIHAVYERYKNLSGTQLSSLTHQPNTPWSIVWDQSGRNAEIPNGLIAAHYEQRHREMTAA